MRHSFERSWAICHFLLASAALGCGSDSDDAGASCGAFAACGGDPIGTWQSRSVCLPDDFEVNLLPDLPTECQSAIALDDLVSNTTLTIGAASFREQGDITLQWSMDFAPDCLSAVSGGQPVTPAAVAAFCDGFQSSLGNANAAFTDVTCDATDTACSCDARQAQTIDQGNPLTIDGAQLVYDGDRRQGFCVSGNQLDLESIPGEGIEQAHIVYERL